MATCKNCLHFEVCDSGRHIGEYIEDDGIYSEGVENECPTFKSTADVVKVKHGEWKINPDGFYPFCSCCGHEPENRKMSAFCPDCGADMRGKQR